MIRTGKISKLFAGSKSAINLWGIRGDNSRVLGQVIPGLNAVTELFGASVGGGVCARTSSSVYCGLGNDVISDPTASPSIPLTGPIFVTVESICFAQGNGIACEGGDDGNFGIGYPATMPSTKVGIIHPTPILTGF